MAYYIYKTQMADCKAAFTQSFSASYSNGASGVGATLTASANGALSADGIALSNGNSVCLPFQNNIYECGLYTVTDAGSISTPGILTRRTDFDSSAEIVVGYYTNITSGSRFGGRRFMVSGIAPTTVGTDSIFLISLEPGIGMLFSFDVTCGQAALAAGGSVTLFDSKTIQQYQIRELFINSGGTNFSGGGGDRLGQITDGTTVFSVIPAADLQTLTNNRWGAAALPYPAAAAINTPTVAGADLVFKYSGGATDYTAGSVVISGVLERVS